MTDQTNGETWDETPAPVAPVVPVVKPKPAKAAAKAEVADDGLVAVRCIVDNEPWTHEGRLARGDVARVKPALAELMKNNGHVELV